MPAYAVSFQVCFMIARKLEFYLIKINASKKIIPASAEATNNLLICSTEPLPGFLYFHQYISWQSVETTKKLSISEGRERPNT